MVVSDETVVLEKLLESLTTVSNSSDGVNVGSVVSARNGKIKENAIKFARKHFFKMFKYLFLSSRKAVLE